METTNSPCYIFDSHDQAEDAIRVLSKSGFDMTKLSLVGRGYHSEQHPIGFYTAGDRIKTWGGLGAFWGAIWGLLAAPAVFMLPGVGVIALAGPITAALIAALEGAVLGGGLSALGGALSSLGIGKDQIIRYETAVKADKFLLLVHGSTDDLAAVRNRLAATPTHEVACAAEAGPALSNAANVWCGRWQARAEPERVIFVEEATDALASRRSARSSLLVSAVSHGLLRRVERSSIPTLPRPGHLKADPRGPLHDQRRDRNSATPFIKQDRTMHFAIYAGAIALALSCSTAGADSSSSETSSYTKTTKPAPTSTEYKATRSEQSVDEHGNVIKKTQTYNSQGANGGSASSSSTTTSSGPAVNGGTVEQERTRVERGSDGAVIEKSSTTTTTTQ